MVKVINQDIPAAEILDDEDPSRPYTLGQAYQQAITEGVPSLRAPGQSIVRTSPKSGRPGSRGSGTVSQAPQRECFSKCGEIWRGLPVQFRKCIKQAWQDQHVEPPHKEIPPEYVATAYSYFQKNCLPHCRSEGPGNLNPYLWFDCCEGAAIGFTSNGMGVNETQQLTAVGGPLFGLYSFTLLSGGGSITPEGLYAAPSSNPNCLNNATIGLNCFGVLIDTLQISINAFTDRALSAGGNCEDSLLYPRPPYTPSTCFYCFNCFGEPSILGPIYCSNSRGAICSGSEPPGWCRGGGVLCSTMDVGGDGTTCLGGDPIGSTHDFRTPEEKAQGCCPPQLL